MPQTTAQVLRCLTLGRLTARVEGDELAGSGPANGCGPQTASIKANRDEQIDFLVEGGDGVWPPAPGSRLREVEKFLNCGLAVALDVVEAAQRRAA